MIRFLADADLDEGIVSGCRRKEPTIDFLSANDAKLEGVPDPEALRIAADQDRILVSHFMGPAKRTSIFPCSRTPPSESDTACSCVLKRSTL